MIAPTPPDSTTRLSRALALTSVGALIALGLAWELWLAPTGRGTLVLKVLPLAVLVPGLWRFRMQTYRILSLLVWLYVAEGLVRATGHEAMPVPALAGAEVALSIVAFGACVLQVRWRLRKAAG